MKQLFISISVLLIICFANVSNAQSWAKTYGGTSDDSAHSVQQTSDGGYIVAGSTQSFGAGSQDVWVLKLDSSGTMQWQKTYGGIYSDRAYSIQQTNDNGYIVAGTTRSFGAGVNDFWILKLDSSGTVQWQKTYGGTDHDDANSVQQTSDGGYIVAGSTRSFGAGGRDSWLLKLDSSGTMQWQKTYGGTDDDSTASVQQTNDNGYIVAGTTYSELSFDYDIWVLRLDVNGTVQWQKTYSATNSDIIYSVQQTSDNGYIVAGSTRSFGAGGSDSWLLKLDSSGTMQWQKTYGGTSDDRAHSVQQTSDGGYIVAGELHDHPSDSWVLKLDSSGTVQWQKTYGHNYSDYANSVQQTSDGGYVVAGNIFVGVYDIWLLKLESSGDIPECHIVGTSDALVTETTLTGDNTILTTSNSSAIISDTSISPQDTSCTVTVVCFDDADSDEDGNPDSIDNCPDDYNPNQEDTYPPQGNGIGDACDCESDFNCDGNVDAGDVTSFLTGFGRNEFNDPCTIGSPCNGDINCDRNVDATDVTKFLEDFGRNQFNNQCPACVVGDWCTYTRFTDNGDGTVTDNYHGLVWLKEAHCSELNPFGVYYTWGEAMQGATSLSNGDCGLTDGSSAGDWRLPTKAEWDAFTCTQYLNPAICDTSGYAQWTQDNPFTCCDGSSLEIQDLRLWTSTLEDIWLSYVGRVDDGSTYLGGHSLYLHVWPLRDP
jgi:uncharacterized delta-60 repeat protein